MQKYYILVVLSLWLLYIEAKKDRQYEWDLFKDRFSKKYDDGTEDDLRYQVWAQRKSEIEVHNQRFAQGLESYTQEENELTDESDEERKSRLGITDVPDDVEETSDRKKRKASSGLGGKFVNPTPNPNLPTSIDWSAKGYVTAVKNQGQCGSCWAFAATGALEGQYYKKYKTLSSFSEQQLVDCSTQNYGCNGGWYYKAWAYEQAKGGIYGQSAYPYTAKASTCQNPSSTLYARVTSYSQVPANEADLMLYLNNTGPIAVAIVVTNSFYSYSSGVYYESTCNTKYVNHAVLLVGYGVETTGEKYWLVKNSWGANWGQKGYIKMARLRSNNCFIASYAWTVNIA